MSGQRVYQIFYSNFTLKCFFNQLINLKSKQSGYLNKAIDFDKMSIEWCDYVYGTTIFPKLPVYIRSYHPTMLANQFIRSKTQTMVSSGQEKKLS